MEIVKKIFLCLSSKIKRKTETKHGIKTKYNGINLLKKNSETTIRRNIKECVNLKILDLTRS